MSDTDLISDLNDLIQLDHDAVAAYTLALDTIKNEDYRERLATYRADHKRHIEELAKIVRDRGGVAVELPHLPTGAFKLAVQAAAVAGGDAAILLAFKTNEGQIRDKYRRYAARPYPAHIAEVVRRGATDEETHYAWVSSVLTQLGHGPRTVQGQAQEIVETVHKRVADAVERVERGVMNAAEAVRKEIRD